VIYSDKGVFRNAFRLPQNCAAPVATLNGLGFECLFANDVYRVYYVSRTNVATRVGSISALE
jgi:hypothetical protein